MHGTRRVRQVGSEHFSVRDIVDLINWNNIVLIGWTYHDIICSDRQDVGQNCGGTWNGRHRIHLECCGFLVKHVREGRRGDIRCTRTGEF